MRDSEILFRAAELIEEKGWIQGEDFNLNGYCMAGAINAISAYPESGEAQKMFRRIICKTEDKGDHAISWINDHCFTDKSEPIIALTLMALYLQDEGE